MSRAASLIIGFAGLLTTSSSFLSAAELAVRAPLDTVAKVAAVTTRDGSGRVQRFTDTGATAVTELESLLQRNKGNKGTDLFLLPFALFNDDRSPRRSIDYPNANQRFDLESESIRASQLIALHGGAKELELKLWDATQTHDSTAAVVQWHAQVRESRGRDRATSNCSGRFLPDSWTIRSLPAAGQCVRAQG